SGRASRDLGGGVCTACFRKELEAYLLANVRKLRSALLALALLFVLASALAAQMQGPAQTAVDLDAIYKIKAEGFGQQSQVMEIMSYLTDVYGPRLTNSPNIKAAAQYVVQKLNDWQL